MKAPVLLTTNEGENLKIENGLFQKESLNTTTKAYQYGLQAIADYLHISKHTVSVWRKNGRLDGAMFHQSGRLIWVADKDLTNCLNSMKKYKKLSKEEIEELIKWKDFWKESSDSWQKLCDTYSQCLSDKPKKENVIDKPKIKEPGTLIHFHPKAFTKTINH